MGKIVIEIKCKEKTCDSCEFIYGEKTGNTFCGRFNGPGDTGILTREGNTYLRLPECLAAEVKEANNEHDNF